MDPLTNPDGWQNKAPAVHHTSHGVDGRTGNRLGYLFYGLVVTVALIGNATAAVNWLGWPLLWAAPAVGIVELGGVFLAVKADVRRRLNEQAILFRTLSAAVAVGAVLLNWFGHVDANVTLAAFFAGLSALGYCVWLGDTGARRRDQLRRDGKLPPTSPAYPAIQWLSHPWLTLRARRLAQRTPTLGLYGSLDAAKAQKRQERLDTALGRALRKEIADAVGPDLAEVALATLPGDELVAAIRASADVNGVAGIFADRLTPERIAAGKPRVRGRVAKALAGGASNPGRPGTEPAATVTPLRPVTGNGHPAVAAVAVVNGAEPVNGRTALMQLEPQVKDLIRQALGRGEQLSGRSVADMAQRAFRLTKTPSERWGRIRLRQVEAEDGANLARAN